MTGKNIFSKHFAALPLPVPVKLQNFTNSKPKSKNGWSDSYLLFVIGFAKVIIVLALFTSFCLVEVSYCKTFLRQAKLKLAYCVQDLSQF